MPYIQSGISQMYCLSPGARESWGVTSFRVEKNLLDFGLVLVPFPRGLTHPFIVQGGPPYKWTKCREREIHREREFLTPLIGVVNPVSRSPQAATVQLLCRGVAILICPYALYFTSRRGRRALICAVWKSRSILNVTPYHSAMMEACLPRRDDVVVFRPLIWIIR
jgi:hypothetical protein